MTHHVLTPEERTRGWQRKNVRPMAREYSEAARRLAEDDLKREISEARAEAETAPLFRWWPDDQ